MLDLESDAFVSSHAFLENLFSGERKMHRVGEGESREKTTGMSKQGQPVDPIVSSHLSKRCT